MRTAADNYVEIRVRARDTAKPDLTSLKADLDELGRKVETAKVSVDDADGKARLLSLNAKLAALNAKVANPKISVSGAARAEAEIALVDAALDHLGDKEEKTSSGRAGISLGSGFLHGFVSFVVPGLKTALVSAASVAMAALPALGAIGGAGLMIGLGAMIMSKIPSVAKQFSAFGTQAMGVLKQAVQPMIGPMMAALKQLGAFLHMIAPLLRQAFGAAGKLIEPLAAGLEGLVAGVLPGLISLLRAAQPALAALANLLSGLGSAIGSVFSAFAPAVAASAKVLAAIGGVINGILPVVAKLAGVFAQALAPVVTALGHAIVALAPALTMIGTIIGKLAGAVLSSLSGALGAVGQALAAVAPGFAILAKVLGQVFTAMENSGVFGILEDAIEAIAGPLGKVISLLIGGLAPVAGVLLSAVAQLASGIGQLLDSAIRELLPGIVALVPMLVQLLSGALRPLIPPVLQLGMALLRILTALLPLLPPLMKLVDLAVLLLVTGLKPLTGVTVVVAEVLAKVAVVIAVVVGWIAKIIAVSLEWITNFKAVGQAIAGVFDWVKSHWPLLLLALTGPIGIAVAIILALFPRLLGGVEHAISGVVGWFRRLPGMILSAIASLGQDLFNAGARIISMLASGIRSAIGDVEGAAHDVVSVIHDFLPFSPAKKGPLSGSGSPGVSGAQIPRMLAQGMTSGTSAVAAAAARMAGAAGIAGAGGMAGARPGLAGAGTGGMIPLQLSLQVNGADSLLLKWIRNQVRIHGGGGPDSVQKAFGRMS